MKKFVSIFLSFLMIFSISISGYAAAPDKDVDPSKVITVEEVTHSQKKLTDPSQFLRTIDPDRTYYTAEKTFRYYEGSNLIYTLTGRFIWSVNTANPTVSSLAIDNMIVVSDTVHISSVDGARKSFTYGGNNGIYISGYIKSTIVGATSVYTFTQTINAYPNGYSHIYGNGGTVRNI